MCECACENAVRVTGRMRAQAFGCMCMIGMCECPSVHAVQAIAPSGAWVGCKCEDAQVRIHCVRAGMCDCASAGGSRWMPLCECACVTACVCLCRRLCAYESMHWVRVCARTCASAHVCMHVHRWAYESACNYLDACVRMHVYECTCVLRACDRVREVACIGCMCASAQA